MAVADGRGGTHKIAGTLGLAWGLCLVPTAAWPQDEDSRRHVVFVEEFAGNCVARGGVQLLVKSTHPTRRIRVWLDRFQMGIGTGDRSRSDLSPQAEPEALGCSRSLDGGTQEWRVARVLFID